jgi:hypothetical protein
MIGFKTTAGVWLEFNATMGLEIRSPYFDAESIPGIQSYPISFSDTPQNRLGLNFPAARSRQAGPVPPIAVDCYLGGTLWRRGQLRYQEYRRKEGVYQYKFEADADALASLIEGVSLASLELGTLAFEPVPETADYVLAPIQNAGFYGEKNPAFC